MTGIARALTLVFTVVPIVLTVIAAHALGWFNPHDNTYTPGIDEKIRMFLFVGYAPLGYLVYKMLKRTSKFLLVWQLLYIPYMAILMYFFAR